MRTSADRITITAAPRTPRMLLIVLLLLAAAGLSGCASLISAYQDQWECPKAKGDGSCEQLSKSYLRSTAKQAIPQPPDPYRTAAAPPGSTPLYQPAQSAPGPDGWVPPVKTIWMAPYVDSAGRRHEAEILRIVVMPGMNVLKPEPEFLLPPVPEQGDDGSLLTPPAPPTEGGGSLGRSNPNGNMIPRTPNTRSNTRSWGSGSNSNFTPGLPQAPTTPVQPPASQQGGFSIPGY